MAVGLGSMDMPVPHVADWEWLNWKFPQPVRAGDTIYARWTLTQKRAPVGGASDRRSSSGGWTCTRPTAPCAPKARSAPACSGGRRRARQPAEAGAAAPASAAPPRRRRRRPRAGAAEQPPPAPAPAQPAVHGRETGRDAEAPAAAARAAAAAPVRGARRRREPGGRPGTARLAAEHEARSDGADRVAGESCQRDEPAVAGDRTRLPPSLAQTGTSSASRYSITRRVSCAGSRGAARDSDLLGALEPVEVQVLEPVDQVGRLVAELLDDLDQPQRVR